MCVCRKEQSSLTQGPSDFLRSVTFPQDLGKGRMKLDEQGMWLGEQRSHGIEAGSAQPARDGKRAGIPPSAQLWPPFGVPSETQGTIKA